MGKDGRACLGKLTNVKRCLRLLKDGNTSPCPRHLMWLEFLESVNSLHPYCGNLRSQHKSSLSDFEVSDDWQKRGRAGQRRKLFSSSDCKRFPSQSRHFTRKEKMEELKWQRRIARASIAYILPTKSYASVFFVGCVVHNFSSCGNWIE